MSIKEIVEKELKTLNESELMKYVNGLTMLNHVHGGKGYEGKVIGEYYKDFARRILESVKAEVENRDDSKRIGDEVNDNAIIGKWGDGYRAALSDLASFLDQEIKNI